MIINIDVDGVLYPSLDIKEYMSAGCFEKYKPMHGDATVAFVVRLRELINRKGMKLKFLTKTCDLSQVLHDVHKKEKQRWLKKNLLATDDEIIVIKANEDKNGYSSGILIDDFGRNCSKWEESMGNIAIQFNETKLKSWLVAKDYDEVYRIIERIIETRESIGGLHI